MRKNIWYSLNGGCGRAKCYPCKSSAGKGISCRQESICYEMVCKVCEEQERRTIYIGESSRSAFERIHEHMWLFLAKKEGDVEKNQSNSVLWHHSKMRTSDWRVKITSSHMSALSRQITEAVRISREPSSSVLNSKNEFGSNNIPELEVRYGTKVLGGGKKRKRKEDEPDNSDVSPSTTSTPSTPSGRKLPDMGPILPEQLEPNLPEVGANNSAVEAGDNGPSTTITATATPPRGTPTEGAGTSSPRRLGQSPALDDRPPVGEDEDDEGALQSSITIPTITITPPDNDLDAVRPIVSEILESVMAAVDAKVAAKGAAESGPPPLFSDMEEGGNIQSKATGAVPGLGRPPSSGRR